MSILEVAQSHGLHIGLGTHDNNLLRNYSPTEFSIPESGEKIAILPTCTTPLQDIESLHDRTDGLVLGVSRGVREYTNIGLIVKSPERTFTRSRAKLEGGDIWWGGPRSNEKAVNLAGQLSVENLTLWEAIFLIELDRAGIPAEKPQAIITDGNGRKQLVVKVIKESIFARGSNHSYERLLAAARKIGLVPEDARLHNCITNANGIPHIIDVIRWSWPPYTDASRRTLLDLIRANGDNQG